MGSIQPKLKKKLKKGATKDQKLVINYLLPFTGLSSIRNKKDAAFDEILTRTIEESDSNHKLLNKIGMTEDEINELPQLVLFGYEYENLPDCIVRVGKDGKARSRYYAISRLVFAENQVFLYKLILDIAGNNTEERLFEYPYKQIAGFSYSLKTIEAIVYNKSKPKTSKVPVQAYEFMLDIAGNKYTYYSNADFNNELNPVRELLRKKLM